MVKNQAGISKEARAIATELYKSGITDLGILANESGLTENQVKEIVSKFSKKVSRAIPEGEASAPIDESQTILDILKQAAPSNKRIGSAVEMFMRFGNLDDLGKLKYVLELSGLKPNEQKIAILRWALHRGLPIPKDIKAEIDRFKVELPAEEKKKLENEVDNDVVDKLIEDKVKRLRKMAKLHELEELEKLYGRNENKQESHEEKQHKKHKMPLIGPDGQFVTTPNGQPIVVESDDILPFMYMQMMNNNNKRYDDEDEVPRHYDDPRVSMLQSRMQRLEGEIGKITNVLDKISQHLDNKNDDKKDNEMLALMNKINDLEKKITADKYETLLKSQREAFETKVNQLTMTITNMQKSLENTKNNPLAQKLDEFKNKLDELEHENRELKYQRERKELDERFKYIENSIAGLANYVKNGNNGKSDVEIVAAHQQELVDSITKNIKEAADMWVSPLANAVVSNQRMQNIVNLAALEQRLGYDKGELVRLFGQTYPFMNQDSVINDNANSNIGIITSPQTNTPELNKNNKKLKKAFNNIIT